MWSCPARMNQTDAPSLSRGQNWLPEAQGLPPADVSLQNVLLPSSQAAFLASFPSLLSPLITFGAQPPPGFLLQFPPSPHSVLVCTQGLRNIPPSGFPLLPPCPLAEHLCLHRTPTPFWGCLRQRNPKLAFIWGVGFLLMFSRNGGDDPNK